MTGFGPTAAGLIALFRGQRLDSTVLPNLGIPNMLRYLLLFASVVFVSACATVASPTPNAALHAELLDLLAKDQQAMRGDGVDKHDVLAAGAARLKVIVKTQGWPTISQVGKDGAQAAWLLAQHADFDVPFQKEALSHMENLFPRGEVNPDNLAYMRDRVAIADGKKQTYGTQGKCNGATWEPFPIDNPSRVDALRVPMTLDPISDYVAMSSRYMCNSGAH
jgi:hypothetical protein